MSLTIFASDVHLIGKLLDLFTSEEMRVEGFTEAEIVRADWINEELDKYLTRNVGPDWDMQEAA